MKKRNQILKLLLLILGVTLFIGCGENQSLKSDAVTGKQELRLNVTLDRSLQKGNIQRFEKQSDITRVELEVKDNLGVFIQHKSLTKVGNRWSSNLVLNLANPPFTFNVRAYNDDHIIIYKGTKTLHTLTPSTDINISLTSTKPLVVNRLPFVKGITKNSVTQGTNFHFTIVNHQQDDLTYIVESKNVPVGCANPFTPSTNILNFGLVQETTFDVILIPDTNVSCQTNSYLLKLTNSLTDVVITPFSLKNNEVSINLPPEIKRVVVENNNATIKLFAEAYDADGSTPLHYQWSKKEGNVSVIGSTNTQTLLLDNYNRLGGAIVLDLNISDDGGASVHIRYILYGTSKTLQKKKVMFFYENHEHNRSELWQLDKRNTPKKIKVLKNKNINMYSIALLKVVEDVGIRQSAVEINNIVYFEATDNSHGSELWRSDGTATGTFMLKDINPRGSSSPYNFINVNGTLYFTAENGSTVGHELWKSDGTTNGTVMVKNINYTAYSNISFLTNVNGVLYFRAENGMDGLELWKSDGTTNGTVMVKNINTTDDGYPSALSNLNGTLYFRANDGTHGTELWKSDGTSSGTVMVKDINPNSADGYPTALSNLNGILYFSVNDGTHGSELWKSDGTSSGTVMVKDINPNGESSIHSIINSNGKLYFIADDGTHGAELWKSDGTSSGTVMVKDINPTVDTHIYQLIHINGLLYFIANDGTHGDELWKSDGTQAGTKMIKDITPNGNSQLENLVGLNNKLYFHVLDPNSGSYQNKLWTSDGTATGTVKIFPLTP